MADTKRDWRRRLLDVRRSLPAADLQRAAEGLKETAARTLPEVRCVALYVAVPPEPETGLLLSWFESRGVRVLLPVLHDDNDLGWGESGAGLVPGRFGLSEPAVDLGPDAVATAELVLCPALAVDRAGTRLGRGGGSYDRAMARTAAPAIAVVYDTEIVGGPLPADPHDRRVGAALTPTRLVELG
jgi:5-formyltetrahydrofolate cyclo-ligase